ncbi:hypothetical protein GOP47_0007252 [Adiantum capillus-veneris]|uniref:Uncharacterized protein n=1 Tax=Adiantum capillus-veneris TaxID=13818 RepID=A0A9D4V0I9_ADICA|nr:hypothetical protein GOP47_0007252 [Adiantum capillus-veneris]
MRNYSPSRGGQQKWTRNNEGFRIITPRSKDEELALFHDMQTRENKNFLHPSTDDIEASLPTKLGGLTGFRISASPTTSWKGNDILATADSDKTDYDWLLTPPGTPLFPSLDKDSLQTYMDHSMVSQPYSASKGSGLSRSNTPELHRMSRRSPGPRTPPSTASSTSSCQAFSRRRAPSPSRVGSSPTLRPTTPVKTLGRSSTIMNRASTRSSPPVLRRTNTSPSIRSSSTERNAPPSKARTSMSPKMQAWQAPELGFSDEPPPNLRTSLSDRPLSNGRSGTARPRMGVHETRHHQEARHSYSDALESRPSHWRNSSSSVSKLSSSTTSQDRWSSRGSVVSSSDDGMDIIEPTFLDFSATSPSSTTGPSKTFSGRFDNEVSSRYSPVLSRQKRLSNSPAETAGFSSASARKSLEPSMQRVDHRRASQNMFRPLMSSAPTTSYCNNGHTAIRHRPANPFVEPSITASSNASSERGVQIFPDNESSDEEVESEWDKGIPVGPVMSKLVLNETSVIGEDYNRLNNHVDHYEQERISENAYNTIDGCETEAALHVNTLEWERVQTSSEVDSQEEEQNSDRSKPSLKCVIHGFIDDLNSEGEGLCNTQQESANQVLTDSKEDVQKSSACGYSDSITLHISHLGQKETDVHNELFHCSKLYKVNDEHCHDARTESRIEQAVCSPERHRSTQDCYSTERSQQMRMNPCIIESITNGCRHESISCHENHITDVNSHGVVELSVQVTLLEKNANFAEKEHGTIIVLQNHVVQDRKNSPAMCVPLSEEATGVENSPSSIGSVVAGKLVSWHVGGEVLHSKSPTTIAHESSHCQETTEGEISSFPSSPSSEMQISLVSQPEIAVLASCREYCVDPLETKEAEVPTCYSIMKPENQPLYENEIAVDSDEFPGVGITEEKASSAEQLEDCQYGNAGLVMNMDGGDMEKINNTVSQNQCVQASIMDDEEKTTNFKALADGLLSVLEVPDMQLQDNEHCPVVDSALSMVPGEANSIEGILAAEACQEGELSNFSDEAVSAALQNIPQLSDVLQQDSSYEPVLMQTAVQDRAVNVNGLEAEGLEGTTAQDLLDTTKGKQQYQKGSPLKTYPNSGQRAATSSFSLEEATNTILFCSSIVHDLIYKAASLATEKEAEAAMKIAPPLVPQSRGQNANAAFISSLRGKVSKSATWKVRHKEAKAFPTKLQKEEVSKPNPTITKQPTPIHGMDREPFGVEADKALPHITKEKSFMGVSVNSNCQCTVM